MFHQEEPIGFEKSKKARTGLFAYQDHSDMLFYLIGGNLNQNAQFDVVFMRQTAKQRL